MPNESAKPSALRELMRAQFQINSPVVSAGEATNSSCELSTNGQTYLYKTNSYANNNNNTNPSTDAQLNEIALFPMPTVTSQTVIENSEIYQDSVKSPLLSKY